MPADDVRQNRIVVHLTDKETARLAAIAKKRDMTAGAVAREILSDALARSPRK